MKKIKLAKLIRIRIIGFLILCSTDAIAEEKEEGISRFFLDYAAVDHSLKNDQGYSMELL